MVVRYSGEFKNYRYGAPADPNWSRKHEVLKEPLYTYSTSEMQFKIILFVSLGGIGIPCH